VEADEVGQRADHEKFVVALHDLLGKLPGRWVVWLDGKVQSDHATQSEAFVRAAGDHGLDGGFLIYRVEPLVGYGIPGGVFVLDDFKKYVADWKHGWGYERQLDDLSVMGDFIPSDVL